MVQKETAPIEKAPEGKGPAPEGSQESGEKKGSPEEKKESPEGNGKKKFKAEAFPLGTPQGEEQTPGGEAKKGDIPPGDETGPSGHKSTPSGERGEKQDPSHPLKEKKKIPSEDKEEIMDEETKKFIADTVGGLEKKVDEIGQTAEGAQDGVKKISQAIEAIKAEATPKTPAEVLSAEEVAQKAVKMIKEEDGRKRKLQGEEEARTKEREKQVELRKWCRDNPQAKECKDLPELIGKIMDERLEKKPASAAPEKKPAQETETKEPEAKLPKKKWDDMTPEERRTLVEEIDRRGEPHSAYYELMRLCSISGKDDACNILARALKDFTVEEVLQELPEEKSQELSKVVCIGDACKPLRQWLKDKEGIALLKKTDKGWKPVDEEVAKEMDIGPHM